LRLISHLQVRDEHRQDYDPGRGGWGAQAQRLEIERRREVEERYADAQEGPGAVAGGGGDWKEEDRGLESSTLKRGRSPDDDGDNARMVSGNMRGIRKAVVDMSFQGHRTKMEEDLEAERM
jgi:nuclear cap-binding protein subunit 2